jgi:hypothetical protein
MINNYKIEVIQTFIHDRIESIDKISESVIEQVKYIDIKYKVRIVDQGPPPRTLGITCRIPLKDYISVSREITLNQLI